MSPEWPIRWLQCDLPAVSRVVNYSSPAWSTRWLQSGLPDAYTVASQMFQEWSTRRLQSGLPDVLILVYQMFLLFSVSSTDVLRMVYQVYRCSRLGSPAWPMKRYLNLSRLRGHVTAEYTACHPLVAPLCLTSPLHPSAWIFKDRFSARKPHLQRASGTTHTKVAWCLGVIFMLLSF